MTKNDKIKLLIDQFDFNEVTASAYVNSDGKCAYCGIDIFNNPLAYETSEIDHILPKSIYPELQWEIKNVVLSCKLCNSNKRDFNVLLKNEKPDTMLLENREVLIKRIREYLENKNNVSEKIRNEVISIIIA